MNRLLAIHVIETLLEAGVEEFVLCPGARNAPFIQLLEKTPFIKHFWSEERSAGFFALGRARALNKPIAIFTTSGTAVAELLPSLMEAYYTSVPLIAVTADRPRRYRHSNAPQTANQENIFGIYTPLRFDLEGIERCTLKSFNSRHPVHLNICLEEPETEMDEHVFSNPRDVFKRPLSLPSHEALENFFQSVRLPLIIVSTLQEKDREEVIEFLLRLKAPVYLEGISGIREDQRLSPFRISHPNLQYHDGVLRLGGVPTHRIWRDLEDRKKMIEILSISDNPFAGNSFAPFIYTEIGPYLDAYQGTFPAIADYAHYLEEQLWLSQELEKLCLEEPNSEQSLIKNLSETLEQNALIYLGNSLPIRHWDLNATHCKSFSKIYANRGLNGIDGQLSTFFGLCHTQHLNVAILGDLTLMYDLVAPWYLLSKKIEVAIIVINNHGGKIFASKFASQTMLNIHPIEFSSFADFWKMPYQSWTSIPQRPSFNGLIELKPDPESTEQFRTKWQAICQMRHAKC